MLARFPRKIAQFRLTRFPRDPFSPTRFPPFSPFSPASTGHRFYRHRFYHVVFAVILQLPDVGLVLQVAGRVVCVGRQGRAGTIFRQVVMFVLRGSL